MLPDAQLLVAAGDSFDDLHIYRFDATTGDEGAEAADDRHHERVAIPC